MSHMDTATQLESTKSQFIAAFQRGDAAGVANVYTAQAQLLPANSDFVQGTDAIRAFWQDALDTGLKDTTLQAIEVEAHGDTAIEVGLYTIVGSDGSVADKGKYIILWKNEAGQWKLHRDIWTTSLPVAAS